MGRFLGQALLESARQLAGGLVDLFLPASCGGCGDGQVAAAGLCQRCSVRLLELVCLPYCPRCGATVGPNIPVRDDGCRGCPNTLPRFAQVIRLGPYADPLRPAVRDLKYRGRDALRRQLCMLLAEAVAARTDPRPLDLVMPIPMHWRRRLGRPFDHARLLAATLAGALDLPLGDELVRTRHTPPQVHLARSRRIENVRGAFGLVRPASLAGAHVLLVDDVTTTGATANEATRTLLEGGVSAVTLTVIAKSEPPTAYADHWRTTP
ncbi:MAG: phosphoribosyltransferase family protein [Phycisphaerae bacterium]|jgi:ComF family protein